MTNTPTLYTESESSLGLPVRRFYWWSEANNCPMYLTEEVITPENTAAVEANELLSLITD